MMIFDKEEYYEIVKPILKNIEFQKRRSYQHHGSETLYVHSIKVSILSYKLAKKINLDYRSIAIGALLHDFYNEPWIVNGDVKRNRKNNFFESHGFVHAREALINSRREFPELLNSKVEDIILRHMFPLNIIPPKYLESWIVSTVDKIVSLNALKRPKEFHIYLKIIGINARMG